MKTSLASKNFCRCGNNLVTEDSEIGYAWILRKTRYSMYAYISCSGSELLKSQTKEN
jgi:hypothetical protein